MDQLKIVEFAKTLKQQRQDIADTYETRIFALNGDLPAQFEVNEKLNSILSAVDGIVSMLGLDGV